MKFPRVIEAVVIDALAERMTLGQRVAHGFDLVSRELVNALQIPVRADPGMFAADHLRDAVDDRLQVD